MRRPHFFLFRWKERLRFRSTAVHRRFVADHYDCTSLCSYRPMIKTLLQQLEDWFDHHEYLAIERTLGGLPIDKFSPRIWEIYVHTLLRLARDNGHDAARYSRALNCMHYMMEEQVERFVHLYYYYAYALAHLDRESEALLFLNAYFEEVVPAFRHPQAEALEKQCLQRISMPHFRLGNFVDRCREMGEILQGIVQPVTDLVQKVEELSLQTNKLAQHQCGIAQQELSQLLYRVAAPLLYQVRFEAVWQDHHVVLQLALDGVVQNLHLLYTLLQELRSYLPPNWKIALPSWKTFVEEHYPDEPRQSTIDQLLAHERTYSTSLPPEAASYEAHLQLTSGWTTQPMLMFEYLQDENFVFNLLRLSGSFCGFIAYNTNIFSSQDDLVSEVRAFNAQLAKSVQQSLDDPAAVQFVGGGFGASAFAHHAQTAYCDFIAYDAPGVLDAITAYFAQHPEAFPAVQAFHRAATPYSI